MSGGDVLLTLGEVAIAVAGFASVVAIFGRRSSTWAPSEAFRVINLVVTASAAALFSFLPFVLRELGSSDGWVWGLSSATLALFIVCQLAWYVTAGRRITRSEPGSLRVWLAVVSTCTAIVALLLQLLNISGLVFSHEFGPFLAGLGYLLLNAVLQFCIVVVSGVRRPAA